MNKHNLICALVSALALVTIAATAADTQIATNTGTAKAKSTEAGMAELKEQHMKEQYKQVEAAKAGSAPQSADMPTQSAGHTGYTGPFPSAKDLASVDFAPPGEFVKDHTFIFHDGLWHLFSISGPLGKGWDHEDGGERTFSHSVSKDLIHWEFAGHILAPGGPGTIDADRIWAPYILESKGTFYLFYSGVIHPNWKRTPDVDPNSPANNFWKGHRVSPCLATSTDLVNWTKQMTNAPIAKGGGQDIFVLYDGERKRFLLYSMGGGGHQVRESEDLRSWLEPVTCSTCSRKEIPWAKHAPMESPFVLRHQGLYYLLLNDGYYVSGTPLNFSGVRRYNGNPPGFAGEIIQVGDRFIRSGVEGERDHYRLRMKEVVFKDGTVTFVE